MKNGRSRNIAVEAAIFVALLVICLFLALRLNFQDGKPVRRGVFYSDKSIYYVYLPATFIYHWDAKRFPHRCDTTYRGFILDDARNKVVAKMTCGVAMLWTPFFLVTHAIALGCSLQADGFSDIYQHAALVPPVVFLLLGLFFLRRFLLRYFPPWITWIALLLIFTGTNLYYFALAEGLMSHVHSFFLFSLYLFLLKKWLDNGMKSFRVFMAISFLIALITLVRPTNAIMALCIFLLDVTSVKEVLNRIKEFLMPKYLGTFLLTAFLVFLPQMIYWKYLSGSFIHYSYGGESFVNWKSPVIVPLLFSPLNGLFTYNPLVLFMVAGFLAMIFRKVSNGVMILLIFALVVWISGSWHLWFFGGSFGARPFVEYYTLFSLGLCFFLAGIIRIKNLFAVSVVALTFTACSWYNLRLLYHNYWNTSSVWAWDDFSQRLGEAGILHLPKTSYRWIQDFENISFEPSFCVTDFQSHSMKKSAFVDGRYPKSVIYRHPMQDIVDGDIKTITVSLWTRPLYDSFASKVTARITDENGHVWLNREVNIHGDLSTSHDWTETAFSLTVPQWMNGQEYQLEIFLTNPGKRTYYIDDVVVGCGM